MKKLTLTLCALTALVSAVYAGTETYSSKDMKTVQTPCPSWYADNEWNIGISGIYAHTVHNNDFNPLFVGDDGWGAAGDIKYFFHRYFGLGVQGFGISTNNSDITINGVRVSGGNHDWLGGVLGTFTLRYPFQCSRFSPFLSWGVGGIWGNSTTLAIAEDETDRLILESGSGKGHLMGQYGAGLEVRFTKHIGWTVDGSYNQVEGPHNDFWMVRSGLNFAF